MSLQRFLWLRRDWLWSPIDPLQRENFWHVLPADGAPIAASDSQLWLRPRGRVVSRGWYLFLVQHRGDNPCATGWLRSGRFGMSQGRPLLPIRLRFRVVHMNRSRPLILELQQVPEPLQLQRLWLLRLPAWEARRRICQRLNRLDRHLSKRFTKSWRHYNQLLSGQAGIPPWISFSQYQQKENRRGEPGRSVRIISGLSWSCAPLLLFVVLLWNQSDATGGSDVVVRKAVNSAAAGLSLAIYWEEAIRSLEIPVTPRIGVSQVRDLKISSTFDRHMPEGLDPLRARVQPQ